MRPLELDAIYDGLKDGIRAKAAARSTDGSANHASSGRARGSPCIASEKKCKHETVFSADDYPDDVAVASFQSSITCSDRRRRWKASIVTSISREINEPVTHETN